MTGDMTVLTDTLPLGRPALRGTIPVAPRHYLILASIAVAAIAVRLLFSSSLSGNDDLSMASCATGMLDGHSILQAGHYCARLGLTLPLAAVFALFGTGGAQISVVPALASIASVLLAWRLGLVLFGAAAGLAAAACVALFPMDVEFAGLAFPDILQGALLAGAMLAVLTATARRGSEGTAAAFAVGAGCLWAWAYYVKIDAAILALVLLAAILMKFVRWRDAIVMGLIALLLVGAEFVAYGILTGDPLRHLHLEVVAANEVLAAGHDYRDLIVYPKTMFLVPYETGLFYFAWLAAIVVAVLRRSRAALFLVAWCVIWQLWLTFGADPTSGFRLKPQLGRYLMSWEVPMAVLVGWLFIMLWRRARWPAALLAAAALGSLAILGPFNQLSYRAAQATRIGVQTAVANHWFPLYTDVQSIGIAEFMLRGRPEAADLHAAQAHDFLHGVTTFAQIDSSPAWMLINDAFARQLAVRNLVRPIDPAGFGYEPVKVFEVSHAMSGLSYASLSLLAEVVDHVPGSLAAHARATVADLLRSGDVVIWRLDQR